MGVFEPVTQRFFYAGLNLNAPPDQLPAGKYPYVSNIRSYIEGTIQPREGLTKLNASPLADTDIHSAFRLNDPTSTASIPALRFLGANDTVYSNDPTTTTFTAVESGFSGDPMTGVQATPAQAVQPWQYLADANKIRKFNVNGDVFRSGLLPPSAPTDEPSAALGKPGLNTISNMDSTAGWSPVGTGAGAIGLVSRVSTTIQAIRYDQGSTGYATVACANMVNITTGTLLLIQASETVLVTDVCVAIADTTIAAIIYDAGVTGLCTIQPAGSLGVGQLEGPPISPYRNRAGYAVPRGSASGDNLPDVSLPAEPRTTLGSKRIRQVDFPVNCMVRLGGSEYVRIISVAVGQDGVQSFRCVTSGTFAAGASISGAAAFRAYFTSTRSAGNSVLTSALRNTLTPTVPSGATSAVVVGGIRANISVNLAQINGRATLPDDDVHIAVRIDKLSKVSTVRVYLDVDPTTPSANDFLQNYFFYEWRANDILAAIQATNAATGVSSVIDARQTTITNAQLSGPVGTPTGSFAVYRGTDIIPPPVPGAIPGSRINPNDSTHQRATAEQLQAGLGQGVSSNADSSQLAVGNNQWIDLKCKVRDLVHVGTDTSRTLANVAAVEILVNANTELINPVQIDYDAFWVQGGYGLDVGDVGTPYVWAYRYRSTITGEVSNPSPALRGGMSPKRQPVTLTGSQSPDAQVDKVDWFRIGGSLTAWTYVRSCDNDAPPTFTDDFTDSNIDAGELLAFDNFPAWPTTDLPRTMVVDVAGTAVRRVSGDAFNTSWSPGSVILVNGKVCTLYASPTSANLLHVNESAGSGSSVSAFLQNATLLGTPLPVLWGDFQNTYFACGDPNAPGTVYWSKTGSPETASDANTVVVTSGADALQNGFMWDRVPYVSSTENLYVLQPQPGGTFVPLLTPCGRGFWARWAWCIAPEGIYFLAKDGIFLTSGGSVAVPITDADLRPLFPHDGNLGIAVNTIQPPDMTATTSLRLSYVAGWLYFDYVAGDGAHTLAYDTAGKRWHFDTYPTQVLTRLWEPGNGVSDQVICGANGNVYASGGTSDNGVAIAWAVWTPWPDVGRPRVEKLFGDYIVDLNPGGIAAGVQVVLGYNDFSQQFAVRTIGATVATRTIYTLDPTPDGAGVLARNVGLKISGSSAAAVPLLYLWEPSLIVKVETTFRRATDWDDAGVKAAKFVQGVILEADTSDQVVPVLVERDGAEVVATLTNVRHNGQSEVAYSFPTPFIAHLLRIAPVPGNDGIRLYAARWVYEPTPEEALYWITQPTTHDFPGFVMVRDALIAYAARTQVAWSISIDGALAGTYVLPSTGGEYRRVYQRVAPMKGRSIQYSWRAIAGDTEAYPTPEPFQLFKRDCVVNVAPWGLGPYVAANPFGGPSRVSGAEI